MSGHLIIPVVQTPTRHHLVLEDDAHGIASVVVTLTRRALLQKDVVGIEVHLDDPDGTLVDCQVRTS